MRQLMIVLAMLCVLCADSLVQARYPYPDYWNGDINYPLVAGKQGLVWYLDKNSIKTRRIDDASIVIACEVVEIDECGHENYKTGKDGTLRSRDTKFYYYDEGSTKMYNLQVENGEVTGKGFLDPLWNAAGADRPRDIGEAAYYVACRKKFYGAYKWSNNKSKDIEVYPASFYSKL